MNKKVKSRLMIAGAAFCAALFLADHQQHP